MTFQIRNRKVVHRPRPSPSAATLAAQQRLVETTRERILDAACQCVIAGVWTSYGNVSTFDPSICRTTYDNHRSVLDELEDEYVAAGMTPSPQYKKRVARRKAADHPPTAAEVEMAAPPCGQADTLGVQRAENDAEALLAAARATVEELRADACSHEARERRSEAEIERLERLRREDAAQLADVREELRRLRAFVDASLV